MIRHSAITIAKLTNAIRKDDGIGFCNACGRRARGYVEPDAERYKCQFKTCGLSHVYGAEQLLLLTER